MSVSEADGRGIGILEAIAAIPFIIGLGSAIVNGQSSSAYIEYVVLSVGFLSISAVSLLSYYTDVPEMIGIQSDELQASFLLTMPLYMLMLGLLVLINPFSVRWWMPLILLILILTTYYILDRIL